MDFLKGTETVNAILLFMKDGQIIKQNWLALTRILLFIQQTYEMPEPLEIKNE
jgi:hypothetical protein